MYCSLLTLWLMVTGEHSVGAGLVPLESGCRAGPRCCVMMSREVLLSVRALVYETMAPVGVLLELGPSLRMLSITFQSVPLRRSIWEIPLVPEITVLHWGIKSKTKHNIRTLDGSWLLATGSQLMSTLCRCLDLHHLCFVCELHCELKISSLLIVFLSLLLFVCFCSWVISYCCFLYVF